MTDDQLTNLFKLAKTYSRRIAIMELNKAELGRGWTTDQQLELEKDQRSLRLVNAEIRQRQTAPDEIAREITTDDARFLVMEDDLAELSKRVDAVLFTVEGQAKRMTEALDTFTGQLLTLETWRDIDVTARHKSQWSLRIILLLLTGAIVFLAVR